MSLVYLLLHLKCSLLLLLLALLVLLLLLQLQVDSHGALPPAILLH